MQLIALHSEQIPLVPQCRDVSLMRLHLSREGSHFYLLVEYLALLVEYLGLLVVSLGMVFTHHILTER
jgi:hypothetical protein